MYVLEVSEADTVSHNATVKSVFSLETVTCGQGNELNIDGKFPYLCVSVDITLASLESHSLLILSNGKKLHF